MKRVVLGMAALVCAAGANAQNKAALYDSTQVEALNEIVVKGVRTQKNAPFAVANIKKKSLTLSQTQVKSCLSFFRKPQAYWHGAKTDWAQVLLICAFAAQAIRAST